MKIEDVRARNFGRNFKRHTNLNNEIEKHRGVDNAIIVAVSTIVAVAFVIYAVVSLLQVAIII